MIEDAETTHMIAEEGPIATVRRKEARAQFVERLIATPPMPARTLGPEQRAELRPRLYPIISGGLERLQTPPRLHSAVGGFSWSMADWMDRMADARPRWLQWGDLGHEVATTARTKFGLRYAPSTLA